MRKNLWENGIKVAFGALGIVYFLYLKRFIIQEWDIYRTKKKEIDIITNKVQINENSENVKDILAEEKNNKTYKRQIEYKRST